ncbi:MAG: nicotinamide-nucleotide amidohydrolase family protein [Rikenellaceae bacterium]
MSIEQEIGEILVSRGETMAAAESCTGGSVAARIVGVAGSSSYFNGGVVAYSNEVKVSILGVDGSDIDRYGAVSEQVARQMAEGARRVFDTTYGVATTGVAGPTGGSAQKPVGTVWFAVATPESTVATLVVCGDHRAEVIESATSRALQLLLEAL